MKLDENLIMIEKACAKEQTLETLRTTFTSFKYDMDRMSEPKKEIARAIYFNNKRRISGTH